MSAIRSKDTAIELKLRRALFRKGHRYRIHYGKAIGKPDVAFPRQKVAVFVDSEFWHGFEWERNKGKIASNRDYWMPKIERNIRRDEEVTQELRAKGWIVLRFWGQEITDDVEGVVTRIQGALRPGCGADRKR
jgi:DNA mismatch endonuclease (patch repair protein)